MWTTEAAPMLVFFEVFENDGLKSLSHSHPVKVSWCKPTIIEVSQPCLVPIDFHLYFWRTMWHMLRNHITIYPRKSWIRFAQNKTNCEIQIDIRKLFKTFNVGDVILLSCSIDPFQILTKLNCHVYVIDFGISFIFNIKDLMENKNFDFNSTNFLINEPSHKPTFERPSIPPNSNILCCKTGGSQSPSN